MSINKQIPRSRGFIQPYLLILIILIAVVLRIVYVVWFGNTLDLRASGYDAYAVNLMAGHGYTRFADFHQDSDLPPLYSFFLVGVYTILGRSAQTVALVQIGLDCITLLGVYFIGKGLGGQIVGLLAAAFTGFYPYLLFQNLSVNDTAIFIMLLTVGTLAIYKATQQGAPRWALLAGLIFGLAALTKTLVTLAIPIIVLWWMIRFRLRKGLFLGIILGVACLIPIAPWVLRNSILHKTFVFISTNDGSNLYQGNNPCVADYLIRGWDAQWVNCLKQPPANLNEVQTSLWMRDQALTYLRENPGQLPRLFAIKFWTLWSPELLPRTVPPSANMADTAVLQYESPLFQTARIIHFVYFAPLLALGLFGIWRAWVDKKLLVPLLAIFLAITITYTVYHPSTRYRSPADPFLFAFSGYAICWLWRKRHTKLETR